MAKKKPAQAKLVSGRMEEKPAPEMKSPKALSWSALLAPNQEKAIRASIVILISVIVFALFVFARNIGTQSLGEVLLGFRSALFLLVCYLFACYTEARGLTRLQTALLVLIPELAITLFLLYRFPVKPVQFS